MQLFSVNLVDKTLLPKLNFTQFFLLFVLHDVSECRYHLLWAQKPLPYYISLEAANQKKVVLKMACGRQDMI